MMKKLLLSLFLVTAFVQLYGQDGIILIRGAQEACLYNSERTNGRICFRSEESGKERKIVVAKEHCKDLLYLIVDGNRAWIRLRPGETVAVNATRMPWKFSGDEKQINNYLYRWTQKYWLERENVLAWQVEMMFFEIPDEKKVQLEISELCTPEYLQWMKEWGSRALADLEESKLKDTAFVTEQKERIYNNSLELQINSFQYISFMKQTKPSLSDVGFMKNLYFERESLLSYPGKDVILDEYFDLAEQMQFWDYSATDFLQKRAYRITQPELRECYLLACIKRDFSYGYFYQGDVLLNSIKEFMVTESGRKNWEKYWEQYQNWKSSPQNSVGKEIVDFDFETIHGGKVKPSNFAGKYLFIDLWATWCGPCQTQIPYLKRLMKELEAFDIEFLSVSVDKPADKEKWKALSRKFGIDEHAAITPDAFNHPLFKEYGVEGVPHFILVDPWGKVLMPKARRPSDPILKKELEELLMPYKTHRVVMDGTIDKPKGKLRLVDRQGDSSPLFEKALDSCHFSLTTLVGHPGFYFLYLGDAIGDVWLEPGMEMQVVIKDGNVEFMGERAGLNNAMQKLKQKYLVSWRTGKAYDKMQGTAMKDKYDALVQEIEGMDLDEIEKKVLIGYWQGYLLDQMYGTIIQSRIMGIGAKRPQVDKNYSASVLRMPLEAGMVYYYKWSLLLEKLLHDKLEAGLFRVSGIETYLSEMAMAIDNEKLREDFVVKALQRELLMGHLLGIEGRIENVRPFVKTEENIQLLDTLLKRSGQARQVYTQAMPGADFSNHAFENRNGAKVVLSDFKGKYVFIDIWSTGCNPCVGEIPYLHDLEKRFAGKPIVWVSVSMDTRKKLWLDFLEKNNMGGIQLLCSEGFKNPFCQKIGLGGIPRFLLLDKEGKMIDNNALRPSNPILGELLDILLE